MKFLLSTIYNNILKYKGPRGGKNKTKDGQHV